MTVTGNVQGTVGAYVGACTMGAGILVHVCTPVRLCVVGEGRMLKRALQETGARPTRPSTGVPLWETRGPGPSYWGHLRGLHGGGDLSARHRRKSTYFTDGEVKVKFKL